MESLKIYEINANYIDYLLPFAPHLFHNSKKGQANSRKYIGVPVSYTHLTLPTKA